MSIGDWRGPLAMGKFSHHFSGPALEGDTEVKQCNSMHLTQKCISK